MTKAEEFFPFVCENPDCRTSYDEHRFREILDRSGLSYVECHSQVFIGITCERCSWTILKAIPDANPVIDLREFIIMPDPMWHMEIAHQLLEEENRESKKDYLHFRYHPAWDHAGDNHDLLRRLYAFAINDVKLGKRFFNPSHRYPDQPSSSFPYLIPSTEELKYMLQQERSGPSRAFRRLYPSTSNSGKLASCLSHARINSIKESNFDFSGAPPIHPSQDTILMNDPETGQCYALTYNTKEQRDERKAWWLSLLEEAKGQTLHEASEALLRSRGIQVFDENAFKLIRDRVMEEICPDTTEDYRHMIGAKHFESAILERLGALFDSVNHRISTDLSLEPARKELHDWYKDLQVGVVRLVEAQMGMGKTHSISDVLAERSDISAVIFMPTLKMCEEIIEQLKTKITMRRGSYYQDRFRYTQEATDTNDSYIMGDDGFPVTRWRRDFLEDEVYFRDGRNQRECPYFKRIIQSYKAHRIKGVKNFCRKCEKSRTDTCRFVKHDENAPRARIVVTTHALYDLFYGKAILQKWVKKTDSENGKTEQATARNIFIIDEDMLINSCYQPEPLSVSDLKRYVTEFNEYLEEQHGPAEAIKSINDFFARVVQCESDAIIPPVDKNFALPDEITHLWKEELGMLAEMGVEHLRDGPALRDYSELLTNGVRMGVSVQCYPGKGKTVNRVYFPNSKSYDLAKLPPHVFFDGTMLPEKLLKRKLKGVQRIDYLKVSKHTPLWKLRVWQNINTELPESTSLYDRQNVKKLIRDLIAERGSNGKWLFLSTRSTEDGYLRKFLKEEFPSLRTVFCHYKNMKGINDAKDSTIGVMVGSFILSPAVECALALDLLKDDITHGRAIIRGNEIYSNRGSGNPKRHYREDYAIVGEMANYVRFSEHRQGLARSRHILHDVDFYVFSKDRVDLYEPLAEIQTDQYRADLFHRQQRSDAKYQQVRDAALKYLQKASSVRIAGLHKIADTTRSTAAAHLDAMVEEGLLVREGRGISGGAYRLNPKGIKRRVVLHSPPGIALNRQSRIDQYGFPFTLNPLIGCFFSCKYCYVPDFMKISREWFWKEVQVKDWLPQRLDYELSAYRGLPQHLKRVQVNESCESYLPEVMKTLKKDYRRDLMAEILEVFESHWLNGNRWMVHIVTKSNLITRHVDLLARLKHMVQIEMSFACLDEKLRRQVETYAPSVAKRFRAVKVLSEEGIFTRVMAMPLICDKGEGVSLRSAAFENGAKAFKSKGLNYFRLEDLLNGKIIKKDRRRDSMHVDLIVKSGEYLLENGQPRKMNLPMPEQWKGKRLEEWGSTLIEKEMEVTDCGYSECNDVDWGYII